LWNEFIIHFKINNINLLGCPIWTEEMDKEYDYTNTPVWKNKIITRNREFYTKNKKFLTKWLQKARINTMFSKTKSKLEWQCGSFLPTDTIWNMIFHFRPSGLRVKRPTYTPTLVAMNQTSIIGKLQRRITAREASLLQSYPINFKLHSNENIAYKQLGNSVNIEVVKTIINYLYSI
jgi:DNA (cytosine-5)-methyltransferase 1